MVHGRILVVEDEPKIAQLLGDYLRQAGYGVTILGRGDQVVAQMRQTMPDLVLLDILLPGKDGMAVCREIRAFSNVPIMMLTARVEEVDRLVGLELGADDYVCKPFSPREVVARVKAVLRRSRSTAAFERLTAGPVELDLDARQVRINGQDVKLTPNEFGLLKVLMSQPNRVFTRGDLVQRVQGYAYDGYERTIDTHIKNLRRKIAEQLPSREVIRTVYGAGYRFDPPEA